MRRIIFVFLGKDVDVMAREPLWSVGLDYRHGTGHGIGVFLNVHEGEVIAYNIFKTMPTEKRFSMRSLTTYLA